MDPKVLRDKIYACWLGKNIGGTLGAFMICNGAKNPLGGVAYAVGCRALGVLKLDVDAESDDQYPEDQTYFNDYANSKLTVVPLMYRRLDESGDIKYWSIYGRVFNDGSSWSAVVNEFEPQILEALSKE